MRRTVLLLAAALVIGICFPVCAQPYPEEYLPPEAIYEEPAPEPIQEPVAEEPAPVVQPVPLTISGLWFETSDLYVSTDIRATVCCSMLGLQPGTLYNVNIVLRSVGSKYADKPDITQSDAFTATEDQQTICIEVPMNAAEYRDVPYGLAAEVSGPNGEYAEDRESMAPVTVVSPHVDVTLRQEARQDGSKPIILDAQVNVSDIEPGGNYEVRTELVYRDTGKPVIEDGKALENEQVLEAPDGYVKIYSVLAAFSVPENLIVGRDICAKVRLFRDGVQIGYGYNSGAFYVRDIEGNIPTLAPTAKPIASTPEYAALLEEDVQEAAEQEVEAQRAKEEERQRLIEEMEAREQTDMITTFVVLGAVLVGLWFWYRKQKREGSYRY